MLVQARHSDDAQQRPDGECAERITPRDEIDDGRQQANRNDGDEEADGLLNREHRADVARLAQLADARGKLRRIGDDGRAPDHAKQHDEP